MKLRWVWTLGLACLAGTSVSLWAAEKVKTDSSPKKEEKSSWLPSWAGGATKEKTTEPAAKLEADAQAAKQAEVDEFSHRVEMAQAKYIRRLQVCNKLTEIADRTNDAPLGRLADTLAERALQVRMKQMPTVNKPSPVTTVDTSVLKKEKP